jgi:peptidoglycan-N-acetylglucosamine deacetylase
VRNATIVIRSIVWAFALWAVIGPAPVHASERCPGGVIALTFDDGPVPSTSELLDVLKREGLRTTFFVVGENVERYPDLARRIVAEGHAIASHSHTHANLTTQTGVEMMNELLRSRQAIREVTGANVDFVRLPYGESNDEVSRRLSAVDLTEVIWTVDSNDWKGAIAPDILRAVRSTQSGGVVLMHDAAPHTRDALPLIAEYLRDNRICAGRLARTTQRMPVSEWYPRAFYVRAEEW